MRCFVRNMLLLSWQLSNFSVVLANLSCFGPKNTLKFAETFHFSTYVPGLEQRFFFSTKHHLCMHWWYTFDNAIIIYCLDKRAKPQKAPSNRKSSSQDCFHRLFSLFLWCGQSKKNIPFLFSLAHTLFWFSFCLFQSTNLNFYKVCSVDALATILFDSLCEKNLRVTSTCKKEGNGTSCLTDLCTEKKPLSIANDKEGRSVWSESGANFVIYLGLLT